MSLVSLLFMVCVTAARLDCEEWLRRKGAMFLLEIYTPRWDGMRYRHTHHILYTGAGYYTIEPLDTIYWLRIKRGFSTSSPNVRTTFELAPFCSSYLALHCSLHQPVFAFTFFLVSSAPPSLTPTPNKKAIRSAAMPNKTAMLNES